MTDQNSNPEGSSETDRKVPAGTVNSEVAPNRRRLFRRLIALAGLGITGVLLSQEKTGILPAAHATTMTIDTANAGAGTTSLNSTLGLAAVFQADATGTGANATTGISGISDSTGAGVGVRGSTSALSGTGIGVFGSSNSPNGIGVQGRASAPSGGVGVLAWSSTNGTGIPLIAKGDSSQSANLQEWQNSSGSALSVVDRNGRLGVGTATPKANLHVANGADIGSHVPTNFAIALSGPNPNNRVIITDGDKTFYFGAQASGNGQAELSTYDYANARGMDLLFNGNGGNVLFYGSNTNVGVGTNLPAHLIHLKGGAYCDGTGAWIAGSSVRWKENIDPLTDGVETLRQLHPVSYNRKETPSKKTMGFIAEEVGKVLPTIVDWDKDQLGYAEGYDHLAILALAVQALKEQQAQIKAMREQQEESKNENENLQERIAILERTVKQFAAS